MDRWREVSFWLEDAGDDLNPRPALDGSVDADVAVLGAGYTGLWTAWYLLQREPSLRVVICEAETAGFGASGRNGAWVTSSLGTTLPELRRRYGDADARRLALAMRDTVDEVRVVCAAAGLDVDYHKGGVLRVARGPHELPALHAGWEHRVALGLDDGCAVLDAEQLAERVRVDRAEGALFDSHCATVHPGRLVRGLARLVEGRGAVIYERTPVNGIHPADPRGRAGRSGSAGGRTAALRTARGDVRATTVVLAGEAWLSRLRPLRRHVLPVYSLIVLTEPLAFDRWDAIGWAGRECVSSHRLTVDYLSRTADGRILFGGRGAPYHFGSRIERRYDRHPATHAGLRRQLVDWFPALHGIGFSHAWGGPLGLPRDWMPTFAHDPRTGLAGAFGYTGQGVATANLAGRVLAELITGQPSELSTLPPVRHWPRRWEPEPLRWLAVRWLQRAVARIDERAERTGRPPSGSSLAERLVRH